MTARAGKASAQLPVLAVRLVASNFCTLLAAQSSHFLSLIFTPFMKNRFFTLRRAQLFTWLPLVAVLLLSACRGPEGDPGLPGPQGPPGADGNGNVGTLTLDAAPQDWIEVDPSGGPGTQQWVFDTKALGLDLREITESVTDRGMVMCYYRNTSSAGTPWTALPFVEFFPFSVTRKLDFSFFDDQVIFFYQQSDGLTPRPDITFFFKVVVVDGNYLVNLKTEPDWTNYREVAELFGLPLD